MSIFDTPHTYTRELIADRCEQVRAQTEEQRRESVEHFYIFVDVSAQMRWNGKRDGKDNWQYPAVSVHGWGADLTWCSEAYMQSVENLPNHTIIRERLDG
jgi:hypothetical protein